MCGKPWEQWNNGIVFAWIDVRLAKYSQQTTYCTRLCDETDLKLNLTLTSISNLTEQINLKHSFTRIF